MSSSICYVPLIISQNFGTVSQSMEVLSHLPHLPSLTDTDVGVTANQTLHMPYVTTLTILQSMYHRLDLQMKKLRPRQVKAPSPKLSARLG